ncbi:MAG: hypothetical protein Solivirus1_61 [Solivirus sp.]|uniref:F-box domain-containing protein n=1 Tax=Solivirus sp. TaxID=2487772 RepID=A0A3G5AH36_9VIRU|nr:MAG: hypothetical protein Solivirus1_61 [Solivirus sp.]
MQYPSDLQKRYANTVFPDLPNELILSILANADVETFSNLCSQPEFRAYCSENSIFSERLYEERAKIASEKRFGKDLLEFKPREMKWREFYNRLSTLIDRLTFIRSRVYILALEGKLMELKIYYKINDGLSDIDAINIADFAAKSGHLEILQWIYDIKGTLPTLYGVNFAAANSHQHVLDWLATKGLHPARTHYSSMAQRLAGKQGLVRTTLGTRR